MTATLRQLAALLLSTAILFTGNGLINTLLPVRAEIEAFSTLEIGLLGSVYFAGFILGCLNVPLVVRRVGHIRTFATLSSVIAATALAHVFIVDPIAWGVLRFLVGFAFAGLYVVIESWLNDRAGTANRGAIMSAYTFISLCVLMAGQFLLTAYDPAGFEPFALIAILIAIALVPVSLTRAPEPPRPATIGLDILGLWRLSPVGFVGCLSVGLVNGSFWSLGPVFASRSGLDIDGLVYFVAGATLAGAILQWPLGLISDRIDRRFVIVGATLCAAASGVLLSSWAEPSTTLLIGLSAAFGGFAMPLYAVSVAHANDKAEDTPLRGDGRRAAARLWARRLARAADRVDSDGILRQRRPVHVHDLRPRGARALHRRPHRAQPAADAGGPQRLRGCAPHLAHPLRAGPALRGGIGRRQDALMRAFWRRSGGRPRRVPAALADREEAS